MPWSHYAMALEFRSRASDLEQKKGPTGTLRNLKPAANWHLKSERTQFAHVLGNKVIESDALLVAVIGHLLADFLDG